MKRAAGVIALFTLVWFGRADADGKAIWRHKADKPITFVQQTALGDLVVGMKESLAGIDEETGKLTWTRDFPGFRAGGFGLIPFSPYAAVMTENEDFRLINVDTGEIVWDMATAQMLEVHGYIALVPHDLLLLYGESAGSKRALTAADLAHILVLYVHDVRVIRPVQGKDFREWLSLGASREDMLQLIESAEPCSLRMGVTT